MNPSLAPEAVADYPRPPRLDAVPQTLTIRFAGREIARTAAGLRVCETTHPPTYYLPFGDFAPDTLRRSARTSVCEWKGRAAYWDVVCGDRVARDAAWSYPAPLARYAALAGHVAVYAEAMEACQVGDEIVTPQPGSFYGGWVTSNLVGPFKGGPGTEWW